MSTRKARFTPAVYRALAERLTKSNPAYAKYTGHGDLSPAQKAAITRAAYAAKIAKPLQPRDDRSYILSARNISKVAPGLKKYRKTPLKTKLTPSQKGSITHKENILRYASNLKPIPKRLARKMRDKFYAPGIQAMNLVGVNQDAKLHFLRKDLTLTQNGRNWLLLSVDPTNRQAMKDAATQAFTSPRTIFPIDQIAALAERAFRRPTTLVVKLWTTQGIVGPPNETIKQFMLWFNARFSKYNKVEEWINGIAVWIGSAPRGRRRAQIEEDLMEDDYDEDEDYEE